MIDAGFEDVREEVIQVSARGLSTDLSCLLLLTFSL